jgi:hypothetical protein
VIKNEVYQVSLSKSQSTPPKKLEALTHTHHFLGRDHYKASEWSGFFRIGSSKFVNIG